MTGTNVLQSKYDSNPVQISQHPSQDDAQIVSFQERYQAEQASLAAVFKTRFNLLLVHRRPVQ